MSQEIIRPRKGRKEAAIGSVAVMVAVEKDLTLMRRSMGIRGSASRRVLTSRLYEAVIGGRKITLAGPMVGAPYAVLILEKLIVLGAKRIIFLGWCGSVQEGLSIGDFLIPERGFIGEGTSRYYLSDNSRRDSRSSVHVSNVVRMRVGLIQFPVKQDRSGPQMRPIVRLCSRYRRSKKKVLWLWIWRVRLFSR